MMLPPDLTQEQQFDDQPLGTHGGMVVRYTFPQDADYDLSIRLQYIDPPESARRMQGDDKIPPVKRRDSE